MKENLTEHELSAFVSDIHIGLGMMKSMQAQHPSAKITFNLATRRISITYPLPKDSVSLEKFTIENIINNS